MHSTNGVYLLVFIYQELQKLLPSEGLGRFCPLRLESCLLFTVQVGLTKKSFRGMLLPYQIARGTRCGSQNLNAAGSRLKAALGADMSLSEEYKRMCRKSLHSYLRWGQRKTMAELSKALLPSLAGSGPALCHALGAPPGLKTWHPDPHLASQNS